MNGWTDLTFAQAVVPRSTSSNSKRKPGARSGPTLTGRLLSSETFEFCNKQLGRDIEAAQFVFQKHGKLPSL
jgi:hypothetical protein